jgi:hypothetical protein
MSTFEKVVLDKLGQLIAAFDYAAADQGQT